MNGHVQKVHLPIPKRSEHKPVAFHLFQCSTTIVFLTQLLYLLTSCRVCFAKNSLLVVEFAQKLNDVLLTSCLWFSQLLCCLFLKT